MNRLSRFIAQPDHGKHTNVLMVVLYKRWLLCLFCLSERRVLCVTAHNSRTCVQPTSIVIHSLCAALLCWHSLAIGLLVPYASDTQSRILYKKLVQVDLYQKLDCVSFLYKFFLVHESCMKWNRVYLMQETCRHVTKIERCDWSACLLTVDDLLFCCLHCLPLLFIICKFLVQETCRSFLYKILNCVSPALDTCFLSNS